MERKKKLKPGISPIVEVSAKRIEAVRLSVGMSQISMAKACNVTLPTYARYETGHIEALPRETWRMLAEMAGVSIAWLQGFGTDDDKLAVQMVRVPLIDMITEEESYIMVEPSLRSDHAFRLNTSMSMRFPPGSIAFCQRCDNPSAMTAIVVRFSSGIYRAGYLSRYGSTVTFRHADATQTATNVAYIDVSDNITILGKILRVVVDLVEQG